MGWGNNTGLLPYGERWRNQRRITHEALHKKASKALWPVVTRQSRLALQRILINPSNYPEEFKLYIIAYIFLPPSLIDALCSMAGSTILSSAYGYEVTSADDGLLKIVETAVNRVSRAAIPGSKSWL